MSSFKVLYSFLAFIFIFNNSMNAQPADLKPVPEALNYNVKRTKKPIKIDANWNKSQWKKMKAVEIKNYMAPLPPKFQPTVQAKMAYDNENIYVIFRVQDRYVKSITKEIGGQVWKDSAVEFFFAPDANLPETYFNLETNCGGTPLLGYRPKKPVVDDIKQIEIAHSLPQTTETEITEPVTWTLEYRIPLAMLEKYSKVTRPKKGVVWKGNFYKIAEITSNPHYITWSPIVNVRPSFHLPKFFGTLKFQ